MPHEFTQEQNESVKTLANRMSFVGIFLILTGIIQWAIFVGIILVGLPNDQLNLKLNYIVSGTVSLLLGYWTKKSSNFFRLVTETEGSDMDHLMAAIVSLRKFYGLWLLCIVFTLFFTVFGGLIAFGIISTLMWKWHFDFPFACNSASELSAIIPTKLIVVLAVGYLLGITEYLARHAKFKGRTPDEIGNLIC